MAARLAGRPANPGAGPAPASPYDAKGAKSMDAKAFQPDRRLDLSRAEGEMAWFANAAKP